MAMDWIKVRCDLRTHPKVVRVASALKSDRLRIVGALHAVWSIFDAHSIDGILHGYTLEILDEEIGWKGFSKALTMPDVGWMEITPDGIVMPRFDTHNGESAKRRATDSERKRQARKSVKPPDNSPKNVHQEPRPEKRREEITKVPLTSDTVAAVAPTTAPIARTELAPIPESVRTAISKSAGKRTARFNEHAPSNGHPPADVPSAEDTDETLDLEASAIGLHRLPNEPDHELQHRISALHSLKSTT